MISSAITSAVTVYLGVCLPTDPGWASQKYLGLSCDLSQKNAVTVY